MRGGRGAGGRWGRRAGSRGPRRFYLAISLLLAICPAAPLPPLHAQIRGVLVDAPAVGQRAPSLILPFVTGAGVGTEPYELQRELGRTVVIGFCVQLADPGCTGFLREVQGADSSFGAGVSVVAVTGDPLGVAAAHLAAHPSQGRVVADERGVTGRRWGVPGGRSDRIGVFVVAWNGLVAYRDLQFSPDDLHARQRLQAAVSAARQPPTAP